MLVPKILISLHEKSITSVSTSPTSVKMNSLKGICLLIVIFANLANCQNDDSSDDYEYSGDDYEYPDDYEDECDKPCDFYDDAKCAKECHHDNTDQLEECCHDPCRLIPHKIGKLTERKHTKHNTCKLNKGQ